MDKNLQVRCWCHPAAHSKASLVAGGGENAVAPYQLLAALSRRLEGEETVTVVDGELTRVYAGRDRTRGHAKHTCVAHTSKIKLPILIYEIKLPRHKPNTAVLVCLLCVNLHQTKRSQVGNLTVFTSLGLAPMAFVFWCHFSLQGLTLRPRACHPIPSLGGAGVESTLPLASVVRPSLSPCGFWLYRSPPPPIAIWSEERPCSGTAPK